MFKAFRDARESIDLVTFFRYFSSGEIGCNCCTRALFLFGVPGQASPAGSFGLNEVGFYGYLGVGIVGIRDSLPSVGGSLYFPAWRRELGSVALLTSGVLQNVDRNLRLDYRLHQIRHRLSYY